MKIPSAIVPLMSLTTVGAAPPPGPWTMGAWRVPAAGQPTWFGEAIQASGGRFWIGKSPSSYCPPNITDLDCTAYPGGSTVFVGGNSTLSLNVVVPGGQQGKSMPGRAIRNEDSDSLQSTSHPTALLHIRFLTQRPCLKGRSLLDGCARLA